MQVSTFDIFSFSVHLWSYDLYMNVLDYWYTSEVDSVIDSLHYFIDKISLMLF